MNSRFKIYIRDTISLVRSLVIKSTASMRATNRLLTDLGYDVDLAKPESWKYYLNLSGQYHEYDEIMTVVSHDNNEEIEFSRENLRYHLLTAKNYHLGSTWVKELMERYPGQENLIIGIINPLDIGEIIESEDHTILAYAEELVESNEHYLIPELQKYINNFFQLRHNEDYELIDPYYMVKLLSGLSNKLVLEVIRLRQEACRTNNAHSFHVRHYISSNSQVGEYYDYMNHNQRMWLYRNIRYINRNVGQSKVFDDVIENVLTNRNFSLIGYDLMKNTTDQEINLKPLVEMGQVSINGIAPPAGVNDKAIREVLGSQVRIAEGNQVVIDESEIKLREFGENSPYGKVPTKVLESTTIDRTNIDPFTTIEMGLNHWIYMSGVGYYNATTTITNPSNGDVYNLSMRDSFILYLYVYNKSLGIELMKVPKVRANRVLQFPAPSFDTLREMANPKIISDGIINEILRLQPSVEEHISPETFMDFIVDVQKYTFDLRELRFFNAGYITEGELHAITERCFMDVEVNLADEMDYTTWLELKNIDFTNATTSDYSSLAVDLMKQAIGDDNVSENSHKLVHKAMLNIMYNLSSYSLQYLSFSNDSYIKVIDGKFPSLADNNYREVIGVFYNEYKPRVIKTHTKVVDRVKSNNASIDVNITIDNNHMYDEVNVDVKLLAGTNINNLAYIDNILPRGSIKPIDELDITGYAEVDNPTVPAVKQVDGIYLTTPGYPTNSLAIEAFLLGN